MTSETPNEHIGHPAGVSRMARDELEAETRSSGRHHLVMFQEPALFPWLDVFGNVMFGFKRKPGLTNKDRRDIDRLRRRHRARRSARASDQHVRLFHDTIGALALGLQTLPSICWVPLALLWFGQSEAATLFVVVMGTVWSVVLATEAGARTIPPIYARVARTMGSEGLDRWTRVILPAFLPFVLSGMKPGSAFAWRSLMAAEIFVTILSGFGLGQLLQYGRELNAMEQVIGVMISIVLIGLIADKALFSPWERFLHRRRGTGLK